MNRALRVAAAVFAIAAVAYVAQQARSHDAATTIVGLNQGWSAEEAAKVHYASQGTVIMPASWIRALRMSDGTLFMSPGHLARLGFVDPYAKATAANPYGWPIGLAVGKVDGVETVGLTCAACHTGQLTYKGTTMRVEGGSANANLGVFGEELRAAVLATEKNPASRARFIADATSYGYPKSRIAGDFAAVAANADSFLYNAGIGGSSTVPGPGRVDALTGIANRIFAYDLHDPHAAIRGIAPTSYPYLWDIWRFDWVQYNASVRVPMGRNVGEALGVGVVTHVVDAAGHLNPEPRRWQTSVDVKALHQIEEALSTLKPPTWPSAVLGAVDPAQAARGRALFAQTCARCHGISNIRGTSPTEWAMHVIPYKAIGTDPNEVLMFAGSRFSGRVLGLGDSLPGGYGIGYFVGRTLDQAYRDAGITKSEQPKYNGWGRTGHMTAPCGYKARPLVGVWATPPFLHNGSVPSVYDMLSDTRPSHPILGNEEYDPIKLGLVQRETPTTMVLDTSKLGNSNAGHWFTNDTSRPGRIGPAWTDAQKYDIIAYLKVATYADYPTKWVDAEYPLPCDRDFNWANGKVPDLHMNAR